MSYSRYLLLVLATVGRDVAQATAPDTTAASPPLAEVLQAQLARLQELVDAFRSRPLSPSAVAQFEKDLQHALREQGRAVLQDSYQRLEPDQPAAAPAAVCCDGDRYRRLNQKTPQQLDTLFGTITLRRLGYRAAPTVGAPVLFPLCRALGVQHGTTPALAERVASYQAESGATQRQTRERLRRDHGVVLGVKRLRLLTTQVATAMAQERAAAQAAQVVAWLTQAQASRGRHRPVLALGRDGITLGLQIKGFSIHEVATTGTLSVYDRRGRRLGTVYLACVPEPGQGTLSRQLTQLLQEVLRRWDGPPPRLCYVTDAGDNETSYYQNVVRRLRHPLTGQRLACVRIVDYYHVSERLWTMAEALFGAGPRRWGWARKMQKLLLKPGGVGRVLHSAAALRSQFALRGKRRAAFQRAYRYVQLRRRQLRYADYRRLGLPIGSGVTEAACKTVFTQRLKLSGMRWKPAGAQTILTLRVILLSGIWSTVYERTLATPAEVIVATPDQKPGSAASNAA